MKRLRFSGLGCALLASCASGPALAPEAPVAAAHPGPAAASSFVRTPPPPALARISGTAPLVTRATLPEGVRVVVVEHHRRPVVTVSLVLPHGTLSDPPDNAGLTYMAVKLASDFYEPLGVNDDAGDEHSFRRRVQELGGNANFEVAPDYSLVEIAGYARDTTAYLKMLWEAVARPRHGARSFRARRNAALDAFEDLESADPEALQELVAQAAFGADHPYARSLFGTTESLNGMELQEVMEHQHLVFSPIGATLLVVGDVRAKDVIAAARAAFDRWEGPAAPVPAVRPPTLPRAAADIGYVERPGASTLFTCATRPLPEVAGTDPTLHVLVAMLGHGMGSRLAAALREQHGLTYGVNAEIVRRRQASALIACSPLQADQAELGLRLFRGVLDGAREGLPGEDEVQRAKALRIGEIDSAYDDVSSTTRAWLFALTLGNGAPRLEQERAEIERVTAKDVQRLARSLLRPGTIRWVLSGDKQAATKAVQANALGKLRPFAPGR